MKISESQLEAFYNADDLHWLDWSAERGEFCHCGKNNMTGVEAAEHRAAAIIAAVLDATEED